MKRKNHLLFSALLMGGVLSSSAFAADTVCSIAYPSGPPLLIDSSNGPDVISGVIPVPDTTIAVASNFYAPALELAQFFLNSSAGTGYTAIGVCHNATGHLVNEISGANPPVNVGEWLSAKINYKYGVFMAANAAGPDNLDASYKLCTPMVYANGIPAFLAGSALGIQDPTWENIATLSGTEDGVEGIYHDFTGSDFTGGKVIMVSTLDKIAIADPVAAPYGNAAKEIITAMKQWRNPVVMPGNNPGNCTATGTLGICQYDNIDITYTETGSSNLKAGWVAWAQIISSGSATPPPYITFPSKSIPQKAVQLTCPYPGNNAAKSFWNFMDLANPDSKDGAFYPAANSRTWNDWLDSRGYGDIPSSAILKGKLRK